jgi:hypothetical protein
MLHATGATATTAMIAPPRRRTHSCWLIALTFLGPDRRGALPVRAASPPHPTATPSQHR